MDGGRAFDAAVEPCCAAAGHGGVPNWHVCRREILPYRLRLLEEIARASSQPPLAGPAGSSSLRGSWSVVFVYS